MNKKIYQLLSVLVLMFPLLISLLPAEVSAEEASTVSVNLHKRVFDEGQRPEDKQNTGEEMSDFGGKALANVTFEVYDVSEQYLENLKDQSAEDATQMIIDDTVASSKVPGYAVEVPNNKQVTNEDGLATFSNLPIKHGDKYATYLFVETNSPANIKEKAAPIVLTMPIYKENTNEINTSIHIYPKNEQQTMLTKDLTEKAKKDLAVTINGQTIYNVEKGQRFDYTVSASLPWNIQDKDFFRVIDTPNVGMKAFADTIKIEGLALNTDYTVKEDTSGRGFVVEFNTKSDKVKALAKQKVTITYEAMLTEDAPLDTGIGNEAKIEVGNGVTPEPSDPTIEGPKVYTGGKKFKKVDDKSGKDLAGAKFHLVKLDAAGKVSEYATYKNGAYTWTANKTEATSYESNAKGEFEVLGLTYSEKLPTGFSYAVEEYEAPEGYALLNEPVKFNVTKGEFEDVVLSITNIKKGLLPSTGGNGIYMFLVVGSVLMMGALVWYRRTKVDAEV